MDYSDLGDLLGLINLDLDMLATEKALIESVVSDVDLLTEPARRIVSGGGKRIRPVLVLAAANGSPDRVPVHCTLPAGVAVELVHIGSLVHDDILDAAAERRGVATVNAMEGWENAILVGDYILGRAGQIAASISQDVAQAIADAIVSISKGQSLETQHVNDVDRSVENALASISGKTADLTRMACKVGALCGGLRDNEIDALAKFGHTFGMSFQLIDDVLDIVSTEELLGKPVGIDIRTGVYTVPVLLARNKLGTDCFRDGMAASTSDDDAAEECLDLVRGSGVIDETIEMARGYAQTAQGILRDTFSDQAGFEGLATLTGWYVDWAVRELVPS